MSNRSLARQKAVTPLNLNRFKLSPAPGDFKQMIDLLYIILNLYYNSNNTEICIGYLFDIILCASVFSYPVDS